MRTALLIFATLILVAGFLSMVAVTATTPGTLGYIATAGLMIVGFGVAYLVDEAMTAACKINLD